MLKGTNSIQDALRAFLQPIKSDDPRLDFYTVYKREATEYDTDYVKKYDEDLNTTLIFVRSLSPVCPDRDSLSNSLSPQAGLFSAVSSAFVIDVQSKLEPDPNEQSAALLRAILLTLNRSALPAETATVPPAQEDPPGEIVTAASLMYASLSISLLAAFVAVLAKQWLNRSLRNTGGSMVERCGDRQRKCEGIEKWPLHLCVESLPVMLQISLLLLACGLCRHMWPINTSVASVLIALTALGTLFYLVIVAAGTSSYECPFQTPASTALRGLWTATRHRRLAIILSSRSTVSKVTRVLKRWIRRHFPRPSPPITLEDVQTVLPVRGEAEPHPGFVDPASTRTNANLNDIRCVSWILKNITDPEAIDAAIRLAGTIRWFEDGIDVEHSYQVITSAHMSCFDLSHRVYPGSTDRAYYSMRAILQIHVFALCRSREFARRFPLSFISGHAGTTDGAAILRMYWCLRDRDILNLYRHGLSPTISPTHLQWASTLLVRFARTKPFDPDLNSIPFECESWDKLPPTIVTDWLIVWCIFMGGDVEEDVLGIEDRSCVTLHISR